MAIGLSPLELALQEALIKAGPGKETEAIIRTYRRMGLNALGVLSPEQILGDIGVLHALTYACELHAYAMYMAGTGGQHITFTEESVAELVEYLCWCQSFFSHLAFVAPDLPPSFRDEVNVEQYARGCSADLADIIAKLQDSGTLDAQERTEGDGEAKSVSLVSISMGTFTSLAKSLLVIVFAWMDEESRRAFTARFTTDYEELQDLRVLVLEAVAENGPWGSCDV